MSSGEVKYNTTRVNNAILYICEMPREQILKVLITRKRDCNLRTTVHIIVVIVLYYTRMSDPNVVHLKLMQCEMLIIPQ